MSDYDRWKTSPLEPTVVGECAHCGAELYANCEYTHDRNENEWFCDDECYVEAYRECGSLATEVKSNDS
jgi:hypothetical protein